MFNNVFSSLSSSLFPLHSRLLFLLLSFLLALHNISSDEVVTEEKEVTCVHGNCAHHDEGRKRLTTFPPRYIETHKYAPYHLEDLYGGNGHGNGPPHVDPSRAQRVVGVHDGVHCEVHTGEPVAHICDGAAPSGVFSNRVGV